MKEIDFIPDWYIAQCRRKHSRITQVTFLAILAMTMVLVSAGRHVQVVSARENLAELQAGLASREEAVEVLTVLDELETRLDELHAKQLLLIDVAGGAPLHAVLAELSHLMPDAMVLKEVRVKQKPRLTQPASGEENAVEDSGQTSRSCDDWDGKVEIAGWAGSGKAVGNLMTNMTRSPLFHEVALRYSKPVVVDSHEAWEFKVTSRLPQFE
ncbi:MAG: PilN domain-containing protein [Phycisphaerae bacterium]|nr:PilN domain-containing protein [Phycisphaerae bacterium]